MENIQWCCQAQREKSWTTWNRMPSPTSLVSAVDMSLGMANVGSPHLPSMKLARGLLLHVNCTGAGARACIGDLIDLNSLLFQLSFGRQTGSMDSRHNFSFRSRILQALSLCRRALDLRQGSAKRLEILKNARKIAGSKKLKRGRMFNQRSRPAACLEFSPNECFGPFCEIKG